MYSVETMCIVRSGQFLQSKLSEDDFVSLLSKVKTAVSEGGPYSPSNPVPLDTSVDVLQMTVRLACCLRVDGITTIGVLVKKSEAEMMRIPNFGRKCLKEINEELAKVGRHLGEAN